MLAHAQLTLEGCQHSAQTNYPLVRQYGLIEKAQEYNLENAGKGYLPQFTLREKQPIKVMLQNCRWTFRESI